MPTLTEERIKSEIADLGARLRVLRAERCWTLDDLAHRTDLSKSYLSRLEDGDRQPSIAALLSIATAFGLALNDLFSGEPESHSGPGAVLRRESGTCGIVRAGSDVPRLGNGLLYRPLLSGDRVSNIQPVMLTIPASRSGDELYKHDGEEWIYVLSGAVCLTLDKERFELMTGDAGHFDARIPHRLTALNGEDAQIILVACSLPRKLLSSYLQRV